jgi:CheY-like chemotaxis protein
MPRLLLINDFAILRGLNASFAGRPEFTLEIAENGEDLHRLALRSGPDLIFAGTKMAKMSGTDLIRRLRQEPATAVIPLVLFGDRREARRSSDAAPDAFLETPVGKVQVAEILRRFFPVPEREARRAEAEVSVVCGNSHQAYLSFTRDISTTGLFLKGVSMFMPGERVRLRLKLPLAPSAVDCDLTGEVVRKMAYSSTSPIEAGIAIRFTDVPADRRLPIARFVRERSVP